MKLDIKSPTATTPATRRGLVIGAGVAGAAALAAKVMPGQAVATTAVATAAKTAVDTAGGYQLTQHVLRYYETTRA